MKALLSSSANPMPHAITTRLTANRAVVRLFIAATSIGALLVLIYIKQRAPILCTSTSGSALCSNGPVLDVISHDAAKTVLVLGGLDSPQPITTLTVEYGPEPTPAVEGEAEWQKPIATYRDVDPNDLQVNQDACYAAFPGIIDDVERPWIRYKDSSIIDDDVNWITLSEGRMRLSIIDKKILIHEVNLPTTKLRATAVATLQSLHDAITSTGDVFNSIDFIMDVKPKVPDVNDPVWAFTRRLEENRIWLMPSSNFLFAFDPDRASRSYVNAVEVAAVASQIVVDITRVKQTRRFVPQPRLGTIGPTREQFITSVQLYENSTRFHDKAYQAVAGWPAGHPPKESRTRALLDNQVFGEIWSLHMSPSDKSSGIEGYGKGVDSATEPGKALCQHRYIVWADGFGSDFIDGVGICRSVIFRLKSKWATLYSRLVEADSAFDSGSRRGYRPAHDPVIERWKDNLHKGEMSKHNLVLVRDDMQDVKHKIEALAEMPEYAESIAKNQAQTYGERYLTKAAAACYWRTLVRAYGDVYVSVKYEKANDYRLPRSAHKLRNRERHV